MYVWWLLKLKQGKSLLVFLHAYSVMVKITLVRACSGCSRPMSNANKREKKLKLLRIG